MKGNTEYIPLSSEIFHSVEKSSYIRKMFEEGIQLKEKYGEENVFDFSLGNPDLDPPEEFFTALMHLVESRERGTHGYMPNAGFNKAREVVAKAVSRDHEAPVEAGHVVMSCGVAGGLNVIFKSILNPGDEVIIPRPCFVEYGFYISNHRGEAVFVDTNDDFRINVQNIEKAISDKTKAVLINSPHNPTGIVYSEKEIIELSLLLTNQAEKKNRFIYLIMDEPYREIVYDNVVVPPFMKHYKQSIVVNSYSKSLSLAGERIGYIAVHPESRNAGLLLEGLSLSTRILGFVNASALMQRVVALLSDVSVDAGIYTRRRNLLIDGLTDAGYQFIKPEGAFYVFCKSPIEDDVEFVNHLRKFNILVVPGSGFGGKGYFRIAYCVPEEVIRKSIPIFKEARIKL